jgi:hypothetical protein
MLIVGLLVAGCRAAPPDEMPLDGGVDGCAGALSHGLDSAHPLVIAGDPGGAQLGYGDPSMIYARGDTAGYLTYTVVTQGNLFQRLATSSDAGASWAYLTDVNAATPITIDTTDDTVCGAATCTGTWVHEVSSIVDDPTDMTRRYKILAHSYFATSNGTPRYEIGSIDLWTAPALTLQTTFTETRLLGWRSSSSRSTSGVGTVVTTDASLAPLLGDCIALTEPGAMVHDGTIELALGCLRYESATSLPIDIRLLRSTDHAVSWSAVSTLLGTDDAIAIGATGPQGPQINAADLFRVGEAIYLFATPNGPVTTIGTATNGYRGCYAFRIDDLPAGHVARCGTAPSFAEQIVGPAGLFHGACTYREGAPAAGVLVLSADVTRPAPFALFATGLSIP